MPKLLVRTTIEAPPNVVWRVLEDLATHVDWMEDAVAIRFCSARRSGVGTAFDCDTRVGPFRLTDRMVVTEWAAPRTMGVRHEGLVTGTGRFTLRRRRHHRTRLSWEERLVYPWWLGGPLGALASKPVLKRIWRRSLRNLKAKVERERHLTRRSASRDRVRSSTSCAFVYRIGRSARDVSMNAR